MSLTIPNNRGPSLSLIAGISEQRGLIHYSIFRSSNNANTFKVFIEGLKLESTTPVSVVMDNLSVHHSRIVKSLFDETFT